MSLEEHAEGNIDVGPDEPGAGLIDDKEPPALIDRDDVPAFLLADGKEPGTQDFAIGGKGLRMPPAARP